MSTEIDQVLKQVRDLVDEVRTTCLWYLRADCYPETVDDALRVLVAVERHGNLATFRVPGSSAHGSHDPPAHHLSTHGPPPHRGRGELRRGRDGAG